MTKIAWFSEMGFNSKTPRSHKNMRTEFAWFVALDAMHHNILKLQELPDNTYDLGTAAKRWRNIYTGDLHLSNETQKKGNDVDGTKGNWTVQEGEENLYLINNKTGKKYKFALEEIE